MGASTMFGKLIRQLIGKFFKTVRSDRKATIVVLLIGLGLLSFVTGMLSEFVFTVLIVAEIVLAFFVGVFELKKIGIELVTFTTVLAGVIYGPIVGLVMGLFLVTIHFILTKSLGPYIGYCIPMMGIVGLLAGYGAAGSWFGGDITTLGILLSLTYNLVTGGLGTVILKDFFAELVWSASNFVLNYVLFLKFAPIILLMLGI